LQGYVPENGSGPATHEERLSMLATAATECARVLHAQPDDHDDAVSAVVEVFAAPLGLDASAMGAAIRSARTAAHEHFAAQPTAMVQPVSDSDRQDRLLRGFRQLQEAATSATPTKLLSLALEFLHEHFQASRSFCFVGSQKIYRARIGLGKDATALLPALHFEIQQRPDVFNAVLGSGKVLFVYREYITAPAQVAVAGAVVARCAGKTGYFKVIEGVFAAQQEIYAEGTVTGLRRILVREAARAGLTQPQVEACLADTAAFEAMDVRVGRAAREEGVAGTPTFMVNGVKVRTPPTGEMDLATLDAAIAAAH
jgi:protein-disulfide isomerase-like protein with CxxC motif